MLFLVHIALLAAEHPGVLSLDPRHQPATNGQATLGAQNVVGVLAVASGDLPAAQKGANTLGIEIVQLEVVEYVAVVGGNLPTADRHAALGRVVAHRPSNLVRAVDGLLDEAVPGEPDEVVPIPDLPLDVAHADRPLVCRRHGLDRIGVEGGVVGDNVADLSGQDPIHRLDDHVVVAPTEPRHHRQALLLRNPYRFHNGPDSGRVHGHGFLAEDVLACVDAGPEVRGTEAWRRGQQDDVNAAVDDALVRIEAQELSRLRHPHLALARMTSLDLFQTSVDTLLIDVSNRCQDCQVVGLQRLCGGACPSASTTNQADLDLLAGGPQQGRSPRRGSTLEESAAGPTRGGQIGMNLHRPRIVADKRELCRRPASGNPGPVVP